MKISNTRSYAWDAVRFLNMALMVVLLWTLVSIQNDRAEQLAPLQSAVNGLSQRIDSWSAYHEGRHNKLAERVDDGFREMKQRLKLLEAKAGR
jgi:hypothetical protein